MNSGKTIGERYDPAMAITTQEEADAFFEELVAFQLKAGLTREEGEEIERDRLGYWAGYYSNETRERVERLFRCAHPVFGKIAENGPPTAEAAFEAGLKIGQQMRKRFRDDAS